MNQGTKIILAVLIFVIGGVGYMAANKERLPNKLDSFAQCLTDNGAVFYGAYWCPHCQAQKKLFGSAMKNVKYVECSLPDGKTRTKECIDANITNYPTWIFKDGSQLTGEVPLSQLAEKTSCELPGSTATDAPQDGATTDAGASTNVLDTTASPQEDTPLKVIPEAEPTEPAAQ
jgi:glutaredoxin